MLFSLHINLTDASIHSQQLNRKSPGHLYFVQNNVEDIYSSTFFSVMDSEILRLLIRRLKSFGSGSDFQKSSGSGFGSDHKYLLFLQNLDSFTGILKHTVLFQEYFLNIVGTVSYVVKITKLCPFMVLKTRKIMFENISPFSNT
jgi:hypothetical protein